MAYNRKIKDKAILLRKNGNSLAEISQNLAVSKGTLSQWLRSVSLSSNARKRIENKQILSQEKATETKQRQKTEYLQMLDAQASEMLSTLAFSKEFKKVICSLLFWAEGSKNETCVSFINSDPRMIRLFLQLLRDAFEIDELKLRGLIHLHEYHDEKETLAFWSQVSAIPVSQFTKPYCKPRTMKRNKPGYKGSCRVRYYDSRVAQELRAIYTTLPGYLSAS